MAEVADNAEMAEWTPHGPALLSREDIVSGFGYLGVDYCLPGDAIVRLYTGTRRVIRRPFAGQMVEIMTASGQQLTATPEHPILTSEGWLPIGALEQGHNVLSDRFRKGTPRLEPNRDYIEMPIEQIFDLAAESTVVPGSRPPRHDFNAGSTGEQVYVVPENSFLRSGFNSAPEKVGRELVLADANVKASTFHALSVSNSGDLTLGATPHSVMCISQAGRSLFGRDVSPIPEKSVPEFVFANSRSHTGDVTPGSDRLQSAFGRLSPPRCRCLAASSRGDARFSQFLADGERVDSVMSSEGPEGLPAHVFADEVVQVRRYPFSGHVYNLETDSHWYSANNILTHNCDNVDTRWSPEVMLGPLKNQVDCSAAGGTTLEANGAALSGTMQSAKIYLYVIRGTKWAKIKLTGGTPTLISDGTETALGEAARSIMYSINAGGTEEISIGMDNTAYRVITAVSDDGVTDTHAANDSSVINRIMAAAGDGSQVPRIAGLGRTGAADTAQVRVRSNDLTSTVTMKTPSWATIDDIGPGDVTFTSFAMDLDYWLVGTDRGPFYVDSRFQHFRELMPEIGQSSDNCHAMTQISWLGTVVPLARGARRQYGLASEGGVGPERFEGNTSPVQGRLTGVAANQLWAYFNVYNPTTDETYLCAVRPRRPGEWHTELLSYFPILTLTNTSSNFLLDVEDANGALTNPTLFGGEDDDVFYLTLGSIPREPDDSNYRFNTAGGTLYLTEMRRFPDQDKVIEYVELETSNCSSTETLTVSIQVDGGTAATIGAISGNGFHRLRVPAELNLRGRRIKPQIAFATGANTTSPRIVGNVRVVYRRYDARDDTGGYRRR